ncbi:MAG TPA: hypothetical protein ENI67_04680 [Gammaproteobacteria bacterium]|nr:hypothetical protein [Gammaproteobacteria bacterium]
MTNPLVIADELLKKEEGFSSDVYPDSKGNRTILYGINLDASPFTRREGAIILKERTTNIYSVLYRRYWFRTLSANRQAVIVNMAYNMGVDGLLGFKKMIAAIEDKNYELAQLELLDSKAARELVNRYNRLAAIMLTDKLPGA